MSIVSVVESLNKIIKKDSNLVQLSPQELINNAYEEIELSRKSKGLSLKDEEDDVKCYPLSTRRGYDYLLHHGVISESAYKYVGKRGNPRPRRKNDDVMKILNHFEIFDDDIEAIRRAIARHPISATMNVVDAFYHHRGDGIYEGPCNPSQKMRWHGVAVVGYGTEDGKEYFLIRNSWGKDWGQDGYAKVKVGLLRNFRFPVI